MTFENPTDNPTWPTFVILAGPWSGIRRRLAVTLLSDTKLWAEYGVNLRDVRSRVFISLPL
jgi:hypothetical protein